MSDAIDPRLEEKFREQLQFLESSAISYDQGAENEALRMATALRVLLHDTKRSKSLFKHLGRCHIQLQSSSHGHGNWQDYLSQEINLNSSEPVRMRPLLGFQFKLVQFAHWWKHEPVFVHKSKKYTREQICLSAANKDGGAHVDSVLEEYYKGLAAGNSMMGIIGSMEYDGPPPFPQGVAMHPKNAHLALIRQFAHEFLATAEHYKWQ